MAINGVNSRPEEENVCNRIRFTMPDPALDKAIRIKVLAEQFDSYINSDTMQTLLNILDIDIKGLAEKYDFRRKKDGGICETQEIGRNFSLEEKKADLYPLFVKLGFMDINKPLSSEYSRILIMGASLEATYLRTEYSADWITPRVVSVDALSCFRPLNPVERTASCFQTDSDTEFGSASDSLISVFGLDRGKWQDAFCGDRNLNRISCIRTYPDQTDGHAFRVFAAPSTDSSDRRADTGDAIKHYMENAGLTPGESLLAVTSNMYCNRQFVQLAYQIIKSDFPVSLDIIGNYCGEKIVSAKVYDPCQYIQDLIATIDWITRFKRDLLSA